MCGCACALRACGLSFGCVLLFVVFCCVCVCVCAFVCSCVCFRFVCVCVCVCVVCRFPACVRFAVLCFACALVCLCVLCACFLRFACFVCVCLSVVFLCVLRFACAPVCLGVCVCVLRLCVGVHAIADTVIARHSFSLTDPELPQSSSFYLATFDGSRQSHIHAQCACFSEVVYSPSLLQRVLLDYVVCVAYAVR